MSVQLREVYCIPVGTRRVAAVAFPNGNVYIRMRDELGELYTDQRFVGLFSERGQPAEAPGRLAWVTVMQFAEGLSDRQAADMVRARIDWKYVLGMELTDPGFDYSVLSEFRGRLLKEQKVQELLNVLLEALQERGLLKAGGRQRTDSTHVLAAIRMLNRLELVGETMRQALNELATVAPEWLRTIAPREWFMRYSQRFDSIRLPKQAAERETLIEAIGADGAHLFAALSEAPAGEQLRQLAGVEILRQVWVQQYWVEHQEDGTIRFRLRADDNQPPGDQRIHSPYDVDARYSVKRSVEWVGYKAHLTETCNDDTVNVITHVETTGAVKQDVEMGDTIHAALVDEDLLPDEHLLDGGYIDAEFLVHARQDLGVEVCGPVKKDVRWQAQAGEGFGLSDFQIDWEARIVACPQGQQSSAWSEQKNAYGQPVIQVKFRPRVCRACPSQAQCTRSKRGARNLVLRPQAQHEALQQARKAQETRAFWARYAKRSGIEGTISEAVRVCNLRRSRYIGLPKTHLQIVATAVAINLHRVFDWLIGTPRAVTRVSLFASLAPDPTLVPTGWHA